MGGIRDCRKGGTLARVAASAERRPGWLRTVYEERDEARRGEASSIIRLSHGALHSRHVSVQHGFQCRLLVSFSHSQGHFAGVPFCIIGSARINRVQGHVSRVNIPH